jgi:protein-tyrosine kinase
MQITVRLKYGSKHRTATESTFARRERPSLSAPGYPDSPSASSFDEQIETGVSNLNRFIDNPKNFPEPAGSSLPSVEGASTKVAKTVSLDQMAVEEVQMRPESRIVMHTDPRSAGADRFRFLRMCLRELWHAGKLKSLQITSPLPQDGKSTIAMNLATAMAEGGKRSVLLIEGDLHRPTLSEQLGLKKLAGLADCLEGRLSPIAAIRRLDPLGWYLLPAGEPRTNPTELLQTDALAGVLQEVSPHFDWVLIDSPPVLPLTDALSIARQVNATLMVAREGRTSHEAIERSLTLIGRQRVLGIVLNAVEGLDRLYSGYYGYGGYPGTNGSKELGPAETVKVPLTRPALQAKRSVFDPPE